MPDRRQIPLIVSLAALVWPVTACGVSSARGGTDTAVSAVSPPSATDRVLDATSEVGDAIDEAVLPDLPASEVSVLSAPLEAIGSSNGPETTRIQLRLIELGFWLDGYDGRYSHTTRQAVMAFQKYSGLEPTGAVDDETAFALTVASNRAIGISEVPGVIVEVDKDRQLLFMMVDGRLEWALNVSTGSGQFYRERNQKDPNRWEKGRSLTPSGFFVVDRERPHGWWSGDLGEIYRPKYFNGGVAIHGSKVIPNYPASHGCVRVSTAAMDMIWESGLVPRRTMIWVYGNDIEPEQTEAEVEWTPV
ncbi:MAG: L,D-transpeptidase family protein [Actinomycetota bacterium]